MKLENFPDITDADAASEEEVGHYVGTESTTASEVIFGSLGPMCHGNGWCTFPQQRTEKRMPGVYRREAIKWGQYQDERPPTALVERWAKPLFNENVALILGPVSGNVFALDIDVKDWDLAAAVEDVAFQVLGFTPFKRVGSAPKRALFYRVAQAEDLPPNSSHFFTEEDGESASEHGLEILSYRKTITIYGRHHETTQRFTWSSSSQPAVVGPEAVPVVTPAQIEDFMAAVQELRAFHRNQAADGTWTFDAAEIVDDGTVRHPRMRVDQADANWVTKDGLVVDGREQYVWRVCSYAVKINPALPVEQVGALALAEIQRTMLLDGSWPAKLEREVREKVSRAHRMLLEGRLKPVAAGTKRIGASGKTKVQASAGLEATPIGWLPSARSAIPASKLGIRRPADAAARASALAIAASAEEVRDRMQTSLSSLFTEFFTTARERIAEQEADENAVVELMTWLARYPAGSGKTHMGIETLDRLRIRPDVLVDGIALAGGSPSPVGFLTPSYENASEVKALAEAKGLKVALIEGEARSGEQDEKDRAAGREPDVLGCRWPRQKRVLAEAGFSGRDMCRTRVVTGNGKDKEVREYVCPFHGKCRPYVEREKAKTADIVIAVHAYVTCHAPEELKACKIVVIDESIGDQITGAVTFDLKDVVTRPRGLARMTKAEREAGLTLQDFTDARDALWMKVEPVLRAGGDPARLFIRGAKQGSRPLTELLDDTIALLGRTEDNLAIRPEMELEKVQELCKRPARTKAKEELIFWRTLRQRVELLIGETTHQDLCRETGSNIAFQKLVHGKTDKRIHCYRDGKVRIAFRMEHNFENAHLLLLDASADPKLLEKTLGRTIVVHEAAAPMRLRTVWMPGQSFSMSSLLPKDDDEEEVAVRKSEDIVRLQEAISTIAAFHVGGVLACLPSKVRKILQKGWAPPANVGFMHFGATRGLNWASRYDAVITIGCIQPSAAAVDAKVAALTYDDETIQEAMVDAIGSMRDKDDEPEDWILADRTIQMRDGREICVRHRLPRGEMAAAVYEQVRREESLQTIARVRPILRDEIPTLYAIGDYLPESIVVDDIFPFDDIRANFGRLFEEARRDGHYLGGGHVVEEDIAVGQKLVEHLGANDRAKEVMIRLRQAGTGKLAWAPAYNAPALQRLADEGEFEVIHIPAAVEIGRPSTWDADRDLYAIRDVEAEEIQLAEAAARASGWEKPDDHGRTVVRIVDGEIVATGDMWTVIRMFARTVSPPSDNDNVENNAEGIPLAA
ncbi:bifunctional DNA primase/polymerase [Jiella sp. M17.18]|uniref:bifunctional DNA primase/polymerase n=1 Tax=Jiella sp. M17.18 TaxID=3234247 RepID=UPI0034DFF5C0